MNLSAPAIREQTRRVCYIELVVVWWCLETSACVLWRLGGLAYSYSIW